MRNLMLMAIACLVILIAAAAATFLFARQSLTAPLAMTGPSLLFEVPAGSSFADVAARLGQQGIVRHPRILRWYARAKGAARHINAGEYELQRGLTPIGLVDKLVSGDVFLHRFTIVEGWRFQEMLAALRRDPAIVSSGLDGHAIMARLNEPGLSPEGEFLPDTYKFPRGTTDVQFLRRAHDALTQRLNALWEQRAADLPLASAYQALILASIIEKETALASERARISGVFNERLKRGMRLQTDPTVIYGLGKAFNGDLTQKDLITDTPYNTYTRSGLPPTPIALPSEQSLEAAVHPDMTGALYFVATGLPDGSHYFSRTLAEHNAAVRRYLERTAKQ